MIESQHEKLGRTPFSQLSQPAVANLAIRTVNGIMKTLEEEYNESSRIGEEIAARKGSSEIFMPRARVPKHGDIAGLVDQGLLEILTPEELEMLKEVGVILSPSDFYIKGGIRDFTKCLRYIQSSVSLEVGLSGGCQFTQSEYDTFLDWLKQALKRLHTGLNGAETIEEAQSREAVVQIEAEVGQLDARIEQLQEEIKQIEAMKEQLGKRIAEIVAT